MYVEFKCRLVLQGYLAYLKFIKKNILHSHNVNVNNINNGHPKGDRSSSSKKLGPKVVRTWFSMRSEKAQTALYFFGKQWQKSLNLYRRMLENSFFRKKINVLL